MAKYYNGVRLPDIPADVLAAYPYCWIRMNTTSGYYDLLLSDKPFYYQSNSPVIYEGNGATGKPWYRVPIAAAETATSWTDNTSATTYSYGLDNARFALWSNHDIFKNAATTLLIHGSEPVDAIAPEGKFYYNGFLLPAIPQGLLGGYPYVWIYRNASNGSFFLMFHPNVAYYKSNLIWDGGDAHRPTYKLSADGESWEFSSATHSAYSNGAASLLWSNHSILNGSATATEVYFYTSEALPESGVDLAQLDYETNTRVYVSGSLIVPNTDNGQMVSYVIPVEKDCVYLVTMTEVGNRLRAAFTTTDPSTITANAAATIIVNDPTFSAGYIFSARAPEDGWMVVYVSNAGEMPDISIAKAIWSDEPETPALVIGPDIRITEGMTIRGGVLHRIVLS